MASSEAIQAVRNAFGDSAVSYFEREADEPARAVLERSVSEFELAQGIVELDLGAQPALDLGGAETNGFSVAAPVTEATEDAVRALLMDDREKGGATACFVTHRFFDVERSEQMNRPVIGYTPGVIASAYLPSRQEPNSCQVALLDRAGSRIVLSEDVERLKALESGPAVLDRDLPRREDRLSAYGDRLVAVDPNGEKVYFETKVEDRFDEPGIGIGGFRGTTYEVVDLTEVVPGDKSAKDLAPLPPDAPQLLRGGGTFVRDGYRIPGALMGTTPPTITWVEGSSGQQGYGPQGGSVIGFGGCSHYNTRDECVNCCNGNQTAGVATVVGAGLTCLAAAWAFPLLVAACGFATGVGIGIFIVGGDACRRNCNAQVRW
jgi:hypothetical protein